MWTPLADTKEEGWKESGVKYPSPEERTLGPVLPGMQPGDWMILGKVFERKSDRQIADEMGLSKLTVAKVRKSATFRRAVTMIEERIADRIARGEFGALAMAKAELIPAMKRLIGMSKECATDAVRYKATRDLIELAGLQAPKPAESVPVERLVDRMTPEEAREFYETGHFPERFHDQLARIAVSSVEEAERRRWSPKVDGVEMHEGDDEREVKQTKPTEEVDP